MNKSFKNVLVLKKNMKLNIKTIRHDGRPDIFRLQYILYELSPPSFFHFI